MCGYYIWSLFLMDPFIRVPGKEEGNEKVVLGVDELLPNHSNPDNSTTRLHRQSEVN